MHACLCHATITCVHMCVCMHVCLCGILYVHMFMTLLCACTCIYYESGSDRCEHVG